MAAELGSYKQAHTSSPLLTLGNSRVVEGPAPLKELGSRAQAMRGGHGHILEGEEKSIGCFMRSLFSVRRSATDVRLSSSVPTTEPASLTSLSRRAASFFLRLPPQHTTAYRRAGARFYHRLVEDHSKCLGPGDSQIPCGQGDSLHPPSDDPPSVSTDPDIEERLSESSLLTKAECRLDSQDKAIRDLLLRVSQLEQRNTSQTPTSARKRSTGPNESTPPARPKTHRLSDSVQKGEYLMRGSSASNYYAYTLNDFQAFRAGGRYLKKRTRECQAVQESRGEVYPLHASWPEYLEKKGYAPTSIKNMLGNVRLYCRHIEARFLTGSKLKQREIDQIQYELKGLVRDVAKVVTVHCQKVIRRKTNELLSTCEEQKFMVEAQNNIPVLLNELTKQPCKAKHDILIGLHNGVDEHKTAATFGQASICLTKEEYSWLSHLLYGTCCNNSGLSEYLLHTWQGNQILKPVHMLQVAWDDAGLTGNITFGQIRTSVATQANRCLTVEERGLVAKAMCHDPKTAEKFYVALADEPFKIRKLRLKAMQRSNTAVEDNEESDSEEQVLKAMNPAGQGQKRKMVSLSSSSSTGDEAEPPYDDHESEMSTLEDFSLQVDHSSDEELPKHIPRKKLFFTSSSKTLKVELERLPDVLHEAYFNHNATLLTPGFAESACLVNLVFLLAIISSSAVLSAALQRSLALCSNYSMLASHHTPPVCLLCPCSVSHTPSRDAHS
ncbi:hypothetical protein L3Q82_015440 [Scortum barcoo]|uniref:Uncharacterized protein n=1 Tax=Scortum barcoo TaxID=214431 RepID=A0ACB8VNJ4_9TELE|nr:hypothetical protein L3Q82_015440 [Scortum barcoo]